MVIRRGPRRLRLARAAVAAVVSLWLLTMFAPRHSYAIAPDIREVTPSGIVIDGASDDWDSPQLDFMALMFEAGKPEKDVLANAYGRYDCGTETFYVHVVAVRGWNILPSDSDNYVKLGQTEMLVSGASGNNGSPPDFTYVGGLEWEASFHLAPGSYLGDGGLNIHAQMVPDARPSTAAPVGRRMDAIIDCTAQPTPSAPTPSAPTPSAPTPSAPTPSAPTPSAPTPSAPTPSAPTPSAPTPSAPTPSAPTPSAPTPSATTPPPVDPPIIVVKVNDQGTADPVDDQIVGGATFEFRQDDGDAVYEPDTDDAPVLAEIEATHGFAVWTPPGPGDFWVTESVPPLGLDTEPPIHVTYEIPPSPLNCSLFRGGFSCVPDEDASGGYVIAVANNSPIGAVGPATDDTGGGELPATDALSATTEGRGPWIVIAGLISLSVGALFALPVRRRR